VFAKLTGMASVCVGGGCLITIEIKRSKGLKKTIFPGMAKLLMPEVDGVGDSMKCARWLEAERVQIAMTIIAEHHCLSVKILDKEPKRVKFDRDQIVTG
jgi:hypothetical protein